MVRVTTKGLDVSIICNLQENKATQDIIPLAVLPILSAARLNYLQSNYKTRKQRCSLAVHAELLINFIQTKVKGITI